MRSPSVAYGASSLPEGAYGRARASLGGWALPSLFHFAAQPAARRKRKPRGSTAGVGVFRCKSGSGLGVDVRNDPTDHLKGQPEEVDAAGDDAKQPPLDVRAEELSAVAVKGQLLTVDRGVLEEPRDVEAKCPGRTEAEREGHEGGAKDVHTDEAEKAAVKLRFHTFLQK